MNIIANFEFTDYQELDEYSLLNAIKHICEFDSITEPYMISIDAKSFSYAKRTITYNINILDLSTGV
jgi:hypothetical protein